MTGTTLTTPLGEWTADAGFVDYSDAADPLATGALSHIPIRAFGPQVHQGGPTREVPLDLSAELGVAGGPATSPALLASFVVVRAGEHLEVSPNATSMLWYVLRGEGSTLCEGGEISWAEGDFVTVPAPGRADHRAGRDALLYSVTDEPLLRYLGVRAAEPRFAPTRYAAVDAAAALEAVATSPDAADRNRISVVLVNAALAQTLTVTHSLWAMFGLVPAGAVQRPHRHQSVALDLIVDCGPGCYTLVGDAVDGDGQIVDPERVDWEAGGAFVTPPGKWHAHHNESDRPAHLVPVQDAGLHTYLRTLDIRFVR
jgi:gentisate 1,2-dioxygenase